MGVFISVDALTALNFLCYIFHIAEKWMGMFEDEVRLARYNEGN